MNASSPHPAAPGPAPGPGPAGATAFSPGWASPTTPGPAPTGPGPDRPGAPGPADIDADADADVDVVVVGAGQAGLSAAYFLRRAGLRFVVLDADDAPGGAWRHRWPTLTMESVHGVHELPGMALPPADERRPAREVVPAYFAAYERAMALPVLRPVRVSAVRPGPGNLLTVESDAGRRTTRALINATGTWRRPFVPYYPGAATFRGRQLRTVDYAGPEEFRGRHVVVVGGGTSAIHFLAEIAEAGGTTTWVTRTPPVFRDEPFTPEIGREVVARVEERVRRGLPPDSVVTATGLPPTAAVRAARERGVLERVPIFDRVTEDGVAWDTPDGPREIRADAIVWATGFRAVLDHLAPLGLRESGGGIRVDGTRAIADPRVHLVGYGPSASTVGANRAGRAAVRDIVRLLGTEGGATGGTAGGTTSGGTTGRAPGRAAGRPAGRASDAAAARVAGADSANDRTGAAA